MELISRSLILYELCAITQRKCDFNSDGTYSNGAGSPQEL